jgi:NTP pyrophosphatase (non-canonical NTP hydrolase)
VTLDDIITECLRDSEDWFPAKARDISFLALALAGEVGEFCNLEKKVVRGTHNREELYRYIEEEVTDVFIYLMNIVAVLREEGYDLVEAYKAKRETNVNRFANPSGWEA